MFLLYFTLLLFLLLLDTIVVCWYWFLLCIKLHCRIGQFWKFHSQYLPWKEEELSSLFRKGSQPWLCHARRNSVGVYYGGWENPCVTRRGEILQEVEGIKRCIWPSWYHCHSLSIASVKSRLVLPFWYWHARVIPDRIQRALKQLCVCVYLPWKSIMVLDILQYLFCDGSNQSKILVPSVSPISTTLSWFIIHSLLLNIVKALMKTWHFRIWTVWQVQWLIIGICNVKACVVMYVEWGQCTCVHANKYCLKN